MRFLHLLFSRIVFLCLNTGGSFVFHLNVNLISWLYRLLYIAIVQTVFHIRFIFEVILRRLLFLLILRDVLWLLRVLNRKWGFAFLLVVFLIRLIYNCILCTLFWILKWTFIYQFNLFLVNILNILTNLVITLALYFQSLLFQIFF